MTVELQHLVRLAALTVLIRIPWMINNIMFRGLDTVTGYPLETPSLGGQAHCFWIAS